VAGTVYRQNDIDRAQMRDSCWNCWIARKSLEDETLEEVTVDMEEVEVVRGVVRMACRVERRPPVRPPLPPVDEVIGISCRYFCRELSLASPRDLLQRLCRRAGTKSSDTLIH